MQQGLIQSQVGVSGSSNTMPSNALLNRMYCMARSFVLAVIASRWDVI